MPKLSNRQLLDNFLASRSSNPTALCSNAPSTSKVDDVCYALVRNIPGFLHSKELRSYFSDFTENDLFKCFHFRHRPELKGKEGESAKNGPKRSTTCCVVSFSNRPDRTRFISTFNNRHWLNLEGMEIPPKCFVTAMKISSGSDNSQGDATITAADLKDLIELKPPDAMPKGNVGTPSQYFLDQIKLCKMPASIIPKLGIAVGRRRRKYEAVNFQYPDVKNSNEECFDSDDNDTTGINERRGPLDDELRRRSQAKERQERFSSIREKKDDPDDPTDKILQNEFGPDNDDLGKVYDDDDQCEEWERHEALHEDVTEQDRTKPKKYEEEMEVVWEKGGPGLVWYMDKEYWDEREKGTDCDWAWADDWDVDYSVYYEGKSAGTRDAQDAVEIRENELKWKGKLEQSVFTKKIGDGPNKRKRRHSGSDAVDIEKFSKGVGKRLMNKMGWMPGTGLGRSAQGRVLPVAIELEDGGQSGAEKKGFGYRGEKLQRSGFVKKPSMHAIATVFDKAKDVDLSENRIVEDEACTSKEILFRRAEPTKMKYR